MQLGNGAQLSGTGLLRIDASGTLATSGGTEGENVALDSASIILNQGLLHVKDGRAEVSQELRFWNTSEVRTDGDLVVSGSTAGFGRILSTGKGTLLLTGEGMQQNGATVSQGSLIVANTTASATGNGSVIANGTGTFGGFGQVGGNVVVQSGGTVAPGVPQGSDVPAINQGVVNAIDFDFTGMQNDLPLAQTSTLNDALRLVSGLDAGSGLIRNVGNEFNVSNFTAGSDWTSSAANSNYVAFTVAPVVGLALQLDDVTFEFQRNDIGAARRFRIFTSIGGFGAWNSGLAPLQTNLAVEDLSVTTLTGNYTGSELVTEPLEVRLYSWDADAQSSITTITKASLDASFVSDPNNVTFDPTGILELGGNYTQLEFATLEIDLGGTQSGEFDQLLVDGNVSLSGTLDVSLIEAFEGAVGQTFDIITSNSVTGTFDNVIAPEGMNVQVNYSNSVVSLELTSEILLGDVNLDGVVNFLDISPFIAVLANGQSQAEADCDDSGVVDFLDITPFITILSGS